MIARIIAAGRMYRYGRPYLPSNGRPEPRRGVLIGLVGSICVPSEVDAGSVAISPPLPAGVSTGMQMAGPPGTASLRFVERSFRSTEGPSARYFVPQHDDYRWARCGR